jgi:hypothetical protein
MEKVQSNSRSWWQNLVPDATPWTYREPVSVV